MEGNGERTPLSVSDRKSDSGGSGCVHRLPRAANPPLRISRTRALGIRAGQIADAATGHATRSGRPSMEFAAPS